MSKEESKLSFRDKEMIMIYKRLDRLEKQLDQVDQHIRLLSKELWDKGYVRGYWKPKEIILKEGGRG